MPFTYFVIPFFKGRIKKEYLRPLNDKIKAKQTLWNGKTLLMAGRLTLIKLVISGAFTHFFFIYKWPSSILKRLSSCIITFFGRVQYPAGNS